MCLSKHQLATYGGLLQTIIIIKTHSHGRNTKFSWANTKLISMAKNHMFSFSARFHGQNTLRFGKFNILSWTKCNIFMCKAQHKSSARPPGASITTGINFTHSPAMPRSERTTCAKYQLAGHGQKWMLLLPVSVVGGERSHVHQEQPASHSSRWEDICRSGERVRD